MSELLHLLFHGPSDANASASVAAKAGELFKQIFFIMCDAIVPDRFDYNSMYSEGIIHLLLICHDVLVFAKKLERANKRFAGAIDAFALKLSAKAVCNVESN